MEIGPQPHGVVRSNIYTAMKVGVQHMLDWVRLFNSGTFLQTDYKLSWNNASLRLSVGFNHLLRLLPGNVFEGGFVDVFTMVKHIDYPRDSETHNITAAIHPCLQVRPEMPSLKSKKFLGTKDWITAKQLCKLDITMEAVKYWQECIT